MIPVAFGLNGRQLMGMYHAAEPARAVAVGVVLCNPLGYEAMCAHRTYRHLARHLALAGFDVLRFDYQGTGDSSGNHDEPGRVRAWIDSISAAVDEVRTLAGVTAVDLFGVRMGATLAVLCAGERHDIERLVLWAPATSGRAYVRELRALSMMQQSSAGLERSACADAPLEALLRELSTVSLDSLRGRLAERALVLPRDDLPGHEERLVAALQACGVETDLRPEPGYARMMDHPESAVVPQATLDVVARWLRRADTRAPPRHHVGPLRSGGLTAWGRTHGQVGTESPTVPVHEQAFSFGEGDRLFGILTEGQRTPSPRTAVVFLNAGANHRVGPNRLYVSMARDVAARGYLAFRFDVGGLGDGSPSPGTLENRVYSKDSVADVRSAMTFLSRIRSVQRFVLVGICSGGFLAFHTSAEDERVVGQILINPQTFEWRPGDPLVISGRKSYKSTRYYLRALRRPSTWAHALRGELDLRGIARVVRARSGVRAVLRLRASLTRWVGLPPPRTNVERTLVAVSVRGVQSLLVFSSNDAGLDMIEEHLGHEASTMKAHPNFRLEVVDGADHTFTQGDAQRRLETLIAIYLESAVPIKVGSPV